MPLKIDRAAFFHKYRVDAAAFDHAGVDWNELVAIADAYRQIIPSLETVGRYVVEALLKCPKVHSIKYRLKDTEHLVEKIIRKKLHDPTRVIEPQNFRQTITDLVGIRALHLFKEDWTSVHTYIRDTWELTEQPIAYVRAGDPEPIVEFYRENGCEVREHRFGYRSVHYLIESNPNRERYIVEIQARTVFEEGWGEIDHVISYPYHTENELLVRLSSVLNRLAANADELGSYMRYLKARTDGIEQHYHQTLTEKNSLIARLQRKIDQLEIGHEQKAELTHDLTLLQQNQTSKRSTGDAYPWLEHLMESNLFKGITERISSIVNSDQFEQIELTDDDIALLENAQQDLLRLMNDPAGVQLMTKEQPLRRLIERVAESAAGSAQSAAGSAQSAAGSAQSAAGSAQSAAE